MHFCVLVVGDQEQVEDFACDLDVEEVEDEFYCVDNEKADP